MREIVAALGHVLFPPHCLLSNAYLGTEKTLVPGIADSELLHHQPAPSGIELMLLLQRHFQPDELSLSSVQSLWAIGTGTSIDNAIYAIKYGGRKKLARSLGAWLTHHPELEELPQDVLIAGVPIHSARRRERGYNQAHEIATGWTAQGVGTLLPPGLLMRLRYTPTQTTQNEAGRLSNVSGAFAITSPEAVHGRNVVLVDDVLTTGATLNACATALLEAGARRVDAATLCAAV